MSWGPILFMFFFLVFFTICIPSAIAGYWCWTQQRADGSTPILKYFAFVLFAISYESLSRLIAVSFGFDGPKPVYTLGYAIAYWQGQFVQAATIVLLVMYLVSGGRSSR